MEGTTAADAAALTPGRSALAAALAALAEPGGYSSRLRPRVKDTLRAALDRGREAIRVRFESGQATGVETAHAQCRLLDDVVNAAFAFTAEHAVSGAARTKGEQMALVATGGYGRGELAPFSDIDLLFLLPYKQTPRSEQVAEFMLYLLWDLGLKVGHATRSVDEALRYAKDDITVRTALLEARWLAGDRELFQGLRRRFFKEIVASTGAAFVEAKLAERNRRHERMGDTRYVLEPNVKEGKGGLRDLQTLFWIAKYLYRVDTAADLVRHDVLTAADARLFARAENFLWTVRCHLHYLSGRAEDRLTFDVQTRLGERMGYAARAGARHVERFMKHYYLTAKDVGDLTRILCAVLEENQKKRPSLLNRAAQHFGRPAIEGFAVESGRITVAAPDAFRRDPSKLLRLFHEAQRHRLDIHPRALRLASQHLHLIDRRLREDPEANRLFLEMLTAESDPETTLKRLNEAGVFGRFVPDFGRVVAQMQYDMYHVYTVDEHTIRAIGILHRIENGELKEDHPVSSQVIHELQSRRVLYLAVLLHDIAKGRQGDHSEIGADIALRMGPRLGFSAWETETVSWLVRHHLLMSRTAFKRDIEDPQTVADFVAAVQSPERLRLLLVLTVADIRAVGPKVWNAWKATLLRELYWRAAEAMTGAVAGEGQASRIAAAKEALRARLADWPSAAAEAHLALGYPSYWLALDTATHVRHAEIVREAESRGDPLHLEIRIEPARGVTELVIYTPDHHGLFARIAGAVALAGASIVDARIATLANGMALDTFWIQDETGGAFEDPARLRRLDARIRETLAGRIDPERLLAPVRKRAQESRTAVFKVPPRVLIDNKASAEATVIEVNGRDRVGFLFDVTAALSALALQIASAHISTYGERVVDVFYVKNIFGLKVEGEERLAAIRRRLLAAIDETAAASAAPPPARSASAAE